MSLTRFTTRNIGTVLVALNTAVPANKSMTAVGMSFCNKASVEVSLDFLVRDAGALDTYIQYAFKIPPGETFYPWGILGKGVMITGDVGFAKSSLANSLDCYMPVYFEAA
jgi:hypothetical protein